MPYSVAPVEASIVCKSPTDYPAMVVWTDIEGGEHQVAANHSVPSGVLLTAVMRRVAGSGRLREPDPDPDDGLVAALGGDTGLADAVLVADRDPLVANFALRPAEIRWQEMPFAPFVVPMFQRLRTGGYRVVDTCADHGPLSAVIAAACAEIGWDYQVFRPPSEAMMASLRELSVDRHWWVAAGCRVEIERIIALCRHTRSIGSLCRAACPDDPDLIRPLVGYLLWHEFLVADLDAPLSDATDVIARSAR